MLSVRKGYIHFSTVIFLLEGDQPWRISSGKISEDQYNYNNEKIPFETAASRDQLVRQQEEEMDELPDIAFVAATKACITGMDLEREVV